MASNNTNNDEAYKQGRYYYRRSVFWNTLANFRLVRWYNHRRAAFRYLTKCPGSFPIYLTLEPTNRCNLSCVFCARRGMQRPVGSMDMPTYRRVIDECAANQLYGLNLFMLGEPLLHPEIHAMITYAKQAGIPVVTLSTNGTLLREDLLDTPLDTLIISFDGMTAATYESLRRRGDFTATQDKIRSFMEAHRRRHSSIYTRLQLIRTKETEPEANTFIAAWRDLFDSVQVKRLNTFRPWYGNEIAEMGVDAPAESTRRPCRLFWQSLSVYWNGEVTACCLDRDGDLSLGHVHQDTLASLWRSDLMQTLRREHRHGVYRSICRDCTDWDFF